MSVMKAIRMNEELAIRIQGMADRERRSFARQAQVLLESAMERLDRPEPEEARSLREALEADMAALREGVEETAQG
jgi:hypothetical protein